MPGLSGLALTTEQTIEILSLYSSSQDRIDAVATAPGWNVIGGFPMPTTADIRLDVFGLVSDASLNMTVRLYDVTPGSVGAVNGSDVHITSTTDDQEFSGVFTLTGGRRYQVQCQVVGNAGDNYFGCVRRAAPAGV
jgi:hypothetical protein